MAYTCYHSGWILGKNRGSWFALLLVAFVTGFAAGLVPARSIGYEQEGAKSGKARGGLGKTSFPFRITPSKKELVGCFTPCESVRSVEFD